MDVEEHHASRITMEVCVDSVESALAARDGGAGRIELCSALSIGGLTPTAGLLKAVRGALGKQFPVFAMIRPRSGDFLYSRQEFEVMKNDIASLKAAGADGFVFGVLESNGTLDVCRNQELVKLAHPSSTTLHRAFDMTRDLPLSLRNAIGCGFKRILTSGAEQTAYKGRHLIKTLVVTAGADIIIMPGSGVHETNVDAILSQTGCHEFHCSGKVIVQSKMEFRRDNINMGVASFPTEYEITLSSPDRLQSIMKAGALASKCS